MKAMQLDLIPCRLRIEGTLSIFLMKESIAQKTNDLPKEIEVESAA